MTYHRASKKQLAYIDQLADQLGETLPWGYQGWSMNQAAVLIRKLERQRDKLENQEQQPEAEQTSLL